MTTEEIEQEIEKLLDKKQCAEWDLQDLQNELRDIEMLLGGYRVKLNPEDDKTS